MIETPDAAWAVLSGSRVVACRAEVWRHGDLLADDVPVETAVYRADRSEAVPESVTITVPVEANGRRWDPIEENDPLNKWGQRLRLSVGFLVNRRMVWVPRGEFLIDNAVVRDGDAVTVTAVSLLQLVGEARLVTPLQPVAGDTFKSLARRLIEPGLPVVFDADLVDRAVPTSSVEFSDDRLGAVYELAKAWPADVRVHVDGYVVFEPFNSVGELVADSREDAVGVTAVTSRDGAINCVVAQGQGSDGDPVQGVAYDTEPSSPARYGGPFSPYPMPAFFSSPLLTTVAECRTAAQTVLARERRKSSRSLVQDMDPLPTLELGDLMLIRDDRAAGTPQHDLAVTIESIECPLTPGGVMSLALVVPV